MTALKDAEAERTKSPSAQQAAAADDAVEARTAADNLAWTQGGKNWYCQKTAEQAAQWAADK
eukprot:5161318-Alexandrium_andersonii.AAC.1